MLNYQRADARAQQKADEDGKGLIQVIAPATLTPTTVSLMRLYVSTPSIDE